ncbi:MAG: M6 family metalloprotease domain-containing protein [Myxococcota bacterium]
MRKTVQSLLWVAAALFAWAPPATATPPPGPGVTQDADVAERLRTHTVRGGLRARAGRSRSRSTGALGAQAAGVGLEGRIELPVLAVRFQPEAAPYPASDLNERLFVANATGTITDYYGEVSGGRLELTGQVWGWAHAPEPLEHYAGTTQGLSPGNAHVGSLLLVALQQYDPEIDFGRFDNDGPDGLPNSGDDDGIVDYIAFTHSGVGAECGNPGSLWSHAWRFSSWPASGGAPYTTNDAAAGGGFIRVNPYTIQPAWSCFGGPVEIGVFCHEFGHALGLPDLYDTDGSSSGVGGWALMASGGYGGNQSQPERPSHLSAWSKVFLGLQAAKPALLERVYSLTPIGAGGEILRVETGNPNEHFLLEYRTRIGFDRSLPGEGLLIWHVDETRVGFGLLGNTVNSDETHYGVGLEQADGEFELEGGSNRGDAGDPFPGILGAQNPNLLFADGTVPSSGSFVGASGVEITLLESTRDGALVRVRPPEGDLDGDGIPDRSDVCPTVSDPAQADRDGDGVGNACDSCIDTENPRVDLPPRGRSTTGRQYDADADGLGDACDADFTRGGPIVNTTDLLAMIHAFGQPVLAWACLDDDGAPVGPCARYDLDETGTVIAVGDLLEMVSRFGTRPALERCPSCPLECEGPTCP